MAVLLKHHPGNANEVGNIGNIRLLAGLLGMQPANKAQGLFEFGVKVPALFMIRMLLA